MNRQTDVHTNYNSIVMQVPKRSAIKECLSERKKKQPAIQIKKETEVSQRLTNFVLQMYHQLISEQLTGRDSEILRWT